MNTLHNKLKTLVLQFGILCLMATSIQAQLCKDKIFSVTIDKTLTIGDVIENLAETCDLTIMVKDSGAQHRLGKNLYYVKLKNASLRGFLDTILTENDLNYELKGNRLSISYLVTRTFKVHYISGKRGGKSNAHVTIANSNGSGDKGGAQTGISITSDDDFKFWDTIKKEVHRVLVSAGDGGTHYTKVDTAWIGPDGQKWEYNPLEPIVNPEAGMVTVTGTAKQVRRVEKYLSSLMNQIKAQVLIDVQILTVKFDNSRTTGVDWSQLYNLQNFTIDAMTFAGKNMGKFTYDKADGIKTWEGYKGDGTDNVSAIQGMAHASVNEVIKFLKTQGDVKSISSPRIMTLSNQPALISVGKELFYKLKASTKKNGDSTEGEMIDSVFAGILLDITPEVDKRGMVTLKINPSITETLTPVTGDGARTMPPDLVRRQLASVIKVKDGNHAILGGLITTTTGIETSKVPLLGDIPLLEYAFKRERKIEKTEELVIIITPKIIKNNRNLSLKDLGYKRLR